MSLSAIRVLLGGFFGLYIDENSAGAGGYDSDFKLIWDNLNLLKKYSCF